MPVKNFLLAGTSIGAELTAAGGAGDTAMSTNTMAGQGLAATAIVAVAAASTGRGVRVNALAADTVRIYHGTASPGAKMARLCDYITPNNIATGTGTTTEFVYLVEDGTFASAFTLRINAARRLEVVNRAGSVATTMTTVLAQGTRYRVEVSAVLAGTPTTSNGTVTVAVYTGESGTALETYTTAGFNLGTSAGFIRWQRFKMSTLTTFDATFDTMRDDIGTESALLGPYVAAASVAPTATITSGTPSTGSQNGTIPLRGTAADADGSVASTLWSWASYPAVLAAPGPTINNPGSLTTASFVPLVAGTYVARLTATDNSGTVSTPATKTITIAGVTGGVGADTRLVWGGSGWLAAAATSAPAAPAPVAAFTASPTSVAAGDPVQFTNTSTNATSYAWTFGDGTTSNVLNPSKTWANAGTYTVTLAVTGPGGSNTLTRTNYVTVTAVTAPAADLVYDSSSTASAQATSLTWDHTVTAAQNRLMLVTFAIPATNGSPVTAVTVGGVGGTRVQQVVGGNVGTIVRIIDLWQIPNPPTGVQPVVVSTNLGSAQTIAAAATTFSGVDQAAPLRTAVPFATTTAVTAVSMATSGGQATDLVYSVAFPRSTTAAVVGADQTSRFVIAGTGSTNAILVGSTEPGGTNVTASYTWTTADIAAGLAVAVVKGAGTTGSGSAFAPAVMPAGNYIDPGTGVVWSAEYEQDFPVLVGGGDTNWNPSSGSRLPSVNPYSTQNTTAPTVEKFYAYERPISTTSKVGRYDAGRTMSVKDVVDGGNTIRVLSIRCHSEQVPENNNVMTPLSSTFIPYLPSYYSKFIRAQWRYRVTNRVNNGAVFGGVWQMIRSDQWPEEAEHDFNENSFPNRIVGNEHPSSRLRLPNTPLPHSQAQDTHIQYTTAQPKYLDVWHTFTTQWEPNPTPIAGSEGRLRWWVDDELIMDRTQWVAGTTPMIFMYQCGDETYTDPNGTAYVVAPTTEADVQIDWCKIWKHPQGTV